MRGLLSRAAVVCATLAVSAAGFAAVEGRPDRSAIVFGYMQQDAAPLQSEQYRYHVFTHIAPPPVGFDSSGNFVSLTTWNNRVADLKPGGAVSNLGVKVICDVVNNGFDQNIVNTVMVSSALRTQLVNNLVSLVTNPSTGCDGIAMDLEWGGSTWNSSARDGINVFLQELNTALKALSPPRELFYYVYPTYNSSAYNLLGNGSTIPSLIDNIDYLLFSAYSDDSSSYMTAIARYPNVISRANGYMTRGVPASKLVMTLPLFGRNWDTDIPIFDTFNGANRRSWSWTSSTMETKYSPPYTKNLDTTTWANWYYFPSKNGNRTYQLSSFDDAFTAEIKMRLSHVWKGSVSPGGQLAGVGFWSLIWPAQGIWPYACDPNTSVVTTALRRTDSLPYTVMEETFAPAGTRVFRAEPFEALTINPNWVSPMDGPDGVNLTTGVVTSINTPVGGRADSDRAALLQFMVNGSNNRLFFKFRVLADSEVPHAIDYDSALVMVDATTSFSVDIYTSAALADTTLRMVVKDANHQLEKGPVVSLASTGWQHIEWDFTDAASVSGYTTAEAAYLPGDGIIQSAGNGARDITFAGFEITAASTLTDAQVVFDNIEYANAYPAARSYVINEFRYADPAQQFVEIYGPAGVIPASMELRLIDSSTGAASSNVAIGGNSIPDDTGNGFGYYVVGTSAVAVRDQLIADGAILGTTPGAMQLNDTATNTIHDAVVFRAYSNRGNLDSPATPIVTDNGPGWLGEIGGGATAAGVAHAMGRYPDGANLGINERDFSLMPASPGAANGNSVALPAAFDFSTAPAGAFRTLGGSFSVEAVAPGMPPSPSGGLVHRCVNAAGGGALSVIGDAALGTGPVGYNVIGEVFVPDAAAPVQANGLGICARTGSDFFNPAPVDSGYDSGFWLVYENAAGVGLADGQADHPGVVQFIYATNNDQDATTSTLLASKTLAELGVTAGQWTTFRLSVNSNASGDTLLAQMNGVTIYSGAIPAGAPTTGGFQIGFRENHAGAPAAIEGTWVDNVQINDLSVPVTVSRVRFE